MKEQQVVKSLNDRRDYRSVVSTIHYLRWFIVYLCGVTKMIVYWPITPVKIPAFIPTCHLN